MELWTRMSDDRILEDLVCVRLVDYCAKKHMIASVYASSASLSQMKSHLLYMMRPSNFCASTPICNSYACKVTVSLTSEP